MSINIAIVEDQNELAESLSSLLQLNNEIKHISIFNSAEDFISNFTENQADVVLMDIGLPKINGIECIKIMKPKLKNVQFLIFTVYEDDENIFDALCAGATGYVLKNSTDEQLINAIKTIHSGGSPMSSAISRKVVDFFSKNKKKNDKSQQVTHREWEILQFLSKGYRYKDIANELFISVDTVRSHIRNIYQKLEVNNKIEALNKFS
jgi:DNA-binding NarL/FixJ family response regulator